ncbi:MAG TPA: SH3 domain-containing protein [Desulfoprunum sp.]|jgi:SH3-like domain-containing protein|nr:SH3 domain-containing protein [Desulfoprunum sp.]
MTFIQNLKKFSRTIIVAGSLCTMLAAPAMAAEYVSVVKDGVNVRTAPNTDAPILMELFQGYPLLVQGKEGVWLKVTDYENDTGYIHSSLVKKGDTVIVNAKKSANMRSEPNTTAPVVADVERGVVLTKLSAQDKWVKVKHSGGTVGWISQPLVWP